MPTDEPSLELPPLTWILTAYALGLGTAVVLSGLYVWTQYDPPFWNGLIFGWTLAAAGAAAGLIIKRTAVQGDFTRFLLWGILISGGRAAIFLLFIVAVHRSGMAGFRPFVIAVFSGYFTSMVTEIAILHTMTGGTHDHE